MKFRRDEAGPPASGTSIEPLSAEVEEVDLYDELVSFSALSPDQQRKELERVAIASAPVVPLAEERPASFDFLEKSDSLYGSSESNSSTDATFNLIDEPLGDPLGHQQTDTPPHAVFNFVEQLTQNVAREDRHAAAELPVTLSNTSPLEDIWSTRMARVGIDPTGPTHESAEREIKCDSCGADSSPEDILCLSCGQLLGDMD